MLNGRATLTLKTFTPDAEESVPAGTCGVLFVEEGTATVVTVAGDMVTIGGLAGTLVDTGPLSLITAATGDFLCWVPLT